MNDAEAKRERLRLLHTLEQLSAGIAAGDRQAEKNGRTILAKIALDGSRDTLAYVYHGLVLAHDEQQTEFEELFG